ncbi:hypothetical protein TREMEDRAFT_58126 [Tremella mesenterica DSM 1558]|uniref:uncharacterized protein n=1 Tax=Tremella mesenterica (strain ATCC 24925 / CBS 8224 / DSM 1558 / NBRC 9311 / NRRL Y-6157 / RJB 2259-6 / UBC 559-6) TaxID=578456 RepID=UPI0003F49906|nr:uncharacterized protein TREMEDRAFT_58126 [Tremella mesenterica DSM 1558]EIW71981.1 hypothetical protein TREMEDRAFT_58126 [Tremella mesenterica DSM 1558]
MSLLQLQLPGAAQGLSQACTTPENGIVQSFSQMWSEAEELRRRCLASQDDQSSIERRQFHACGMAFNLAQLLSKHKQLKDSLQLASDETVCQAAASFSKNHPDGLPLILPTSEVEQFKDIFHRLKAMHQCLSTRLSESIQWDCTKSQIRSTTNLAKEQAKADANLILDGIRAFTFVWLSTHSRLCITKVAPESKALQILQDKLTDGHSVTATQIVKAAAQEYLELTQGGSRTNQLQNDKVGFVQGIWRNLGAQWIYQGLSSLMRHHQHSTHPAKNSQLVQFAAASHPAPLQQLLSELAPQAWVVRYLVGGSDWYLRDCEGL